MYLRTAARATWQEETGKLALLRLAVWGSEEAFNAALETLKKD